MLRQACDDPFTFATSGFTWLPSMLYSYDLDLDTRLSEETTVLVENYTVRTFELHVLILINDID